MDALSRRLGIVLLVVLTWGAVATAAAQEAAPPAPAPVLAGSVEDMARMAATHFQRREFDRAWEALLRRQAADPRASEDQGHRRAVEQTATAINQEANRLLESGNAGAPDSAIRLGSLLMRPDSISMATPIFGERMGEYLRTSRLVVAFGHYRRGEQQALRGQKARAEEDYRQAIALVTDGERVLPGAEEILASSRYNLGVLVSERAMALLNAGNTREGAEVMTEAIVLIREAARAAGNDEALRRAAAETDARLTAALAPIVQGPTPTPTTAVQGLVDFFRGDVMANARRALEKDGLIGGHLDTIITALIAIAIFAVIYWLIPGTILSRLAKGGNLVAGSWRLKVPWIGLLALVMYYIQTGSSNREDRRAAAKAGCPHCGARLDRPSDYTDLVFTKCPKCKGAITPIHTLEGYIKELADGLASDVERVHRGVESMERFVGRDAVGILVRALITLGVRRRASDLHFEPTEEAMVVRQRIDGMITEMTQLPRSLSAALVSAIKVQSNLNIAEKRVPQDGKMQMHIDKTDIDIRVATSPSGAGEKASLRLLDIRSIQMDTRHLGMSPSNEEIFNRAISAPHGLILVSGPTGSGKTTTIYVALQQLKKTSKNIISIEDPIEFRIPGVSQMQVNVAQGLTFASGLRSILRQDPDVIMVGEIRDRETAEISVNSAQTGHLVFSTLHTIDAAASIARLIDLGVNPRMFVDALNLIVAQRLIRLACSHCAAEDVPDLAVLRELGIDNESIGQYKFRRGLGCHVCNGTGYFRRSGLFECLEPSDRLRVAIEKGSLSTGEIREVAIKGGLRTLRMEALDLLARGLTPAEEVLRVTK